MANALGYKNGSRDINRHVAPEDRQVCQIDGVAHKRDLIVINEVGLYSLILRSNLPKAREFKRWLTSKVLPSIRKHGAMTIRNA